MIKSAREMREPENLSRILEEMKGEQEGEEYEEELPSGVEMVKRVSGLFDYTEFVLTEFDKHTIDRIAEHRGYEIEEKRKPANLMCSNCSHRSECITDGEPPGVYTIKKPRKLWFPVLIADIVKLANAIRIYDTKKSRELGSDLIETYLNETDKK